MPAKPKPMPTTLEACHARIRTLSATLRQRLDPPCYVRYLVERLVPQVGASDIARAVGRGLDVDTVGKWYQGEPVTRQWHTRKVIHSLEMRLWEITVATERRGGEEREQDTEDDTFRGEAFELHQMGSMEDMLVWLADYGEDSAIKNSTIKARRRPAKPPAAAEPPQAAPAPAPAVRPPSRRVRRSRLDARRLQLPFRFFELEEMFL